ncbi:MAG: hypothetical protein KAJ93_02470 [Methanosarcinales archaeon]|nr:hypothetical protein [Methanosarcinales archaeon]
MPYKCSKCNSDITEEQTAKTVEKFEKALCNKCILDGVGESAPSAPDEEPAQQTHNVGDGSKDDVPVLSACDEPTIIPEHIEILPSLINADIVRPAITAQDAIAAWKEFQNLKTAILDKTDIMVIQGNNYTKKAGWRKFATFYNLTDKITEETRTPTENGSFLWKIKVECTAPNGRTTEGVAMCSSTEKSGKRIEHDTYATAHTRAKNRAISDMIAAGEVSAEEIT